MAGVHRLEHVERLAAAHLADDDPVGAHPQGVAHERAQRHLAPALDVRRPALEPDDVRLRQPQLGGVLDGHDPLGRVDEAGERVQQRRLARAGAARHDDVQPPAHAALEQIRLRGGEAPGGDEVVDPERRPGEPADREQRPVERERREHRVHATAVGEPGVDHRARLVDPPADRADDAVDHVAQMLVVAKRHRLAHEPPGALGVDPTRRR